MVLESPVALFLLSVIAVCAVVMTATVVVTAREARRTFRRINTLLPSCRQTLRQTRELLAAAHHAAHQADLIVTAVSGLTAHALRQFLEAKRRVEQWLHHASNGNSRGVGSGARPFRHRMS